jgi:Fe2+ transport system protein FeoA
LNVQTLIALTDLTLAYIDERSALMHKQNTPQQASTLSTWFPGSEGTVSEISGPARFAARLRELGLLPGVRLRLLRSGSALIIQIGETRLAIRKRDAEAIRVYADGT